MIKLLVADDSALMRKLLEGIFLTQGDFDIRFARNGMEALELVRTFKPDVVTLDVKTQSVTLLRPNGIIRVHGLLQQQLDGNQWARFNQIFQESKSGFQQDSRSWFSSDRLRRGVKEFSQF